MKYLQFIGLCVLAWWPMMAIHELGHVIGSMFSGASIERIVLWPWGISETIRTGSKAPLVDTWFGPVFGVVAPAMVYYCFKNRGFRGRSLLGFFCGFCFVSNGLYIGVGWIDSVGDSGDLVQLGSPVELLLVFGIGCLTIGMILWHLELFQNKKPQIRGGKGVKPRRQSVR